MCRVSFIIVLSVILVACGGAGAGRDDDASQDDQVAASRHQPIVVTEAKGDFRASCSPRRIGTRLRGLGEALDTVAEERLARYWGKGFAWFRLIDRQRTWFAAETYRQGVSELVARKGLRFVVTRLRVGPRGSATLAGFFKTPEGDRKVFVGKVQVSCARPTIKAISVSVFDSFADSALSPPECPRPRQDRPPGAMIVCGRGD